MEVERRVVGVQKLGIGSAGGQWPMCLHLLHEQKDGNPRLLRSVSLRLLQGQPGPGEGEQDLGGGAGALPSPQVTVPPPLSLRAA